MSADDKPIPNTTWFYICTSCEGYFSSITSPDKLAIEQAKGAYPECPSCVIMSLNASEDGC